MLSQVGHGSGKFTSALLSTGRIAEIHRLPPKVFRFFIKTRAVAPPSAIAALIESSSPLKSKSPSCPSPSLPMSRSSSRSTNVGTPIEDSGTEHVLVVEDNLINQTVLKRQLIKAGLSCNGQSHPIPFPLLCDFHAHLDCCWLV